MPIKLKPSIVTAEKQSNGTVKKVNVHYYMKCAATKDLMEAYENRNSPRKLKDKIKKELVRRGLVNANV